MAATDDADEALKRLGGGRWQTRDERFTIEPQSGTWAVVDAEQTDELGLPLVRGPFGSLRDAKEAIAAARRGDPPASPLKGRAAARATSKEGTKTGRGRAAKQAAPREPLAPRWMRDLEPAQHRRAARLIEQLAEAGAGDPEGIVRRDLVGEVPAVAAFAVERAIRGLRDGRPASRVADVLIDGRDPELGVRWRLVDGDGRPIPLDVDVLDRD